MQSARMEYTGRDVKPFHIVYHRTKKDMYMRNQYYFFVKHTTFIQAMSKVSAM